MDSSATEATVDQMGSMWGGVMGSERSSSTGNDGEKVGLRRVRRWHRVDFQAHPFVTWTRSLWRNVDPITFAHLCPLNLQHPAS